MYIKNRHSTVGVVGAVARHHMVGEHNIDLDHVVTEKNVSQKK